MASCLFFFLSRSGTWSIFPTVRRFRADAAYVGTSHCFIFHALVPGLPSSW